MELTRNLPSADELIRALGLNSRHSSAGHEVLPGLALFGAGILVGAGLALLFAPVTGEELRGEITQRAGELRDQILPTDSYPEARS